MTDVQLMKASAPAVPGRQGVSIATVLARSEAAIAELSFDWPGSLHELQRWEHGETPLQRWKRARMALETAPPRSVFEGRLADIVEHLKPAQPGQARAMVGMLVDAFPNGRPQNAVAYMESILHDVVDMGFSAVAIAMACRELRRSSRFLPTVAEVVGACGEASAKWRSEHRVVEHLLSRLSEAERSAASPEPEPTPLDSRLAREASAPARAGLT
ncbi:hypothetical protein CSW58_09815 [Caulobacter sp. B11]|uniref:hypothetical protein n=1 Tax=Caulobacter sp. B11 TaxID=2048899 RepID=UPI000C12E122|nr:hypothetical protein [Caulobacter sp. B11]PHY12850.1 hypothetical protein CSW58_09815 [Caulobacter sp. B11]